MKFRKRKSGKKEERGLVTARRKRKEFAMFSVGDLVVHPMHGAGVIDAIVQEKVAGSTQDYMCSRCRWEGWC